ncbi:helix-turn-helix transcriptional regulator [Streptomyces sp. GMY02]|uniref:PadR family transcriptional regulator n=1 Tax=Streptomyces sp. GMY02 TaxID=1333528 RepID=UPI001C2BDF52|nr:PadR family transcriptional regulator [Streptomyces sp. GMY02]QXE34768.1 helix-turn-helix transcriptional regulator [Streptomyces sp. GMY02]
MPPVFAHGRLRLYLLKLLDEAPRHGYEVIRLLEERFQGLYAPSAGTVYPRLAKLEAEGLVTHATEGGRKVYSITDAGRAELAGRSGELADLELEIRESVSELAAEIRDDVRGAAGQLRSEMRAAASESRTGGARQDWDAAFTDSESWRAAKEELKRAKQEWKEQARRAKDESRRAREDAQQARRQAKEAQESAREEMQRIAKQVQEQVQDHFLRGDWPTGVREGLSELAGQLSGLARGTKPWPTEPGSGAGAAAGAGTKERGTAGDGPAQHGTAGSGTKKAGTAGRASAGHESAESGASAAYEHGPAAPAPDPAWAADTPETGDPARDLERLLDRFRDDIRDAARDNGVTPSQLAAARRHLSTAAAHISAVLRMPGA